ncbi:MAG: hypothetical protein JSS96_16065 [Bacteroidetes bacterium]|nr:hypothetical protein [Bacteroidota bacterium]
MWREVELEHDAKGNLVMIIKIQIIRERTDIPGAEGCDARDAEEGGEGGCKRIKPFGYMAITGGYTLFCKSRV